MSVGIQHGYAVFELAALKNMIFYIILISWIGFGKLYLFLYATPQRMLK